MMHAKGYWPTQQKWHPDYHLNFKIHENTNYYIIAYLTKKLSCSHSPHPMKVFSLLGVGQVWRMLSQLVLRWHKLPSTFWRVWQGGGVKSCFYSAIGITGVNPNPNHPNLIRIRLKRMIDFLTESTFDFALPTFDFHFPSEVTPLIFTPVGRKKLLCANGSYIGLISRPVTSDGK